jgi:hypothetical protein
MEVKLTKEEQAKYDEVYTKITSQYNAEDLATLEADGVAKYYLKQIILKYVFTGEFPKDFKTQPLKNTPLQEEVNYDATIPLEEGKEPLINSVETICNNINPDVDVEDIISSLKIERTKSDELNKPIQDE